jgi:hypothetical protein
MTKSSFLKTAAFLVLLAGSITGAYAQITVSGGLALSRVDAEAQGRTYTGEMGIGGNVYLDYLLPISIPLSLGAEIGVDRSTVGDGFVEDTVVAVPLLLRLAYHFDLFPKLDLYVVGKLGYAIGTITSGPDEPYLDSAGGFAIGIDAGAAYYFTPIVGVFAEVGVDDYMVEAKATTDWGYSFTVDTPFYRFLTFGLSLKF